MDRTRIAGIAGIVAAAGAAAGALVYLAQLMAPSEPTLATGLVFCLFHLAAIVGLTGLAAQGAAGRGWLGRVGIVVAIGMFALLCVAELAEPLGSPIALLIYELAPSVMGVAWILLGVAVVRHGRWSGWRRPVPLASGLFTLVVFLPLMITLGESDGAWVVLAAWQLTLVAAGVAVAGEARAPRSVPQEQAV